MWPGQQPPGGEQNPQQPNPNPYQQPGYQQPNPYQQPGYQQQPGPYAGPPGQQPPWGAPTVPAGPAVPGPPPPGDDGRRTKLVALVAAVAVVVAAGVTGFLVLGGDEDGKETARKDGDKKPSERPVSSAPEVAPEESAEENPRGGDDIKPTVAGWKVVYNPKRGVAFDVPADWEVDSPGMSVGFEERDAKEIKPLIVMSAPAYLKSKWCESDDDKDGRKDSTSLATVGTKGANGAKDAEEAAVNQVPWWVYGGYTQPDKKSMRTDKNGKPFTTTSGIKGSIARAESTNTPRKGKCATDGKAVSFGFKNSKGDFVAWNLYGAKGVKDEVPDSLITEILKTVRLHGEPTD
ncbi:hypothetical protein ACIP88_23345 [Streptomyces uncialis]|uniref:hypothetical protein n=1 Tax=Streptomyces uncialis TaxID=1048205 RepID=UPI0037FAE911